MNLFFLSCFNLPSNFLFSEILTEDAALWPSPEGRSLLVASFNDSQVGELPVLRYGGGFPTQDSLRYPFVRNVTSSCNMVETIL